jgi:hypothetical protein
MFYNIGPRSEVSNIDKHTNTTQITQVKIPRITELKFEKKKDFFRKKLSIIFKAGLHFCEQLDPSAVL